MDLCVADSQKLLFYKGRIVNENKRILSQERNLFYFALREKFEVCHPRTYKKTHIAINNPGFFLSIRLLL